MGPNVVLVDFGGTGIDPLMLGPTAAALARQANEQFALPPPIGYGIGIAALRVGTPGDIKPDEWLMGLFEHPDMPGALGYHDRTPSGKPLAKIFPKLDHADGADWRVTLGHELLETLADPELCRAVQAPDGKFYALEVCDAVEQDTYLIDGVPMTNWNTSAYFEPPDDLTGIKLDWMGLCKKPFEIRPGGYGQFWTGSGWQEVFASKTPRAARRAPSHRGRRAIRSARLSK